MNTGVVAISSRGIFSQGIKLESLKSPIGRRVLTLEALKIY